GGEPMTVRMRRLTSLLLLLALAAGVTVGCAKKAKEAPPVVPPTPPVTTPDTTPPPPPPPPKSSAQATNVKNEDFQPALFDFDSYTLREDARGALDKDAGLLRSNATVNVTVEGHCDERGTAEYNQALGEKRAQAARDYLVAAG